MGMPGDVVAAFAILCFVFGMGVGYAVGQVGTIADRYRPSKEKEVPVLLDMRRLQEGETILLMYERVLNPDQRNELRKRFKEMEEREMKLLVLEGGCKALVVGKDNQVALS